MPKYRYERIALRLLLTLALVSILGLLAAQGNTDEYDLVKTFVLPKTAVPVSELTLSNESWSRDGELFTGIAFERFENGNLSRVLSLFRGLQQGPMYLWYPDGAPQMSAIYRQGRLNGRFLGWYRNGGVIYDMAINQSGYAGDYLSREGGQEGEDIYEPEGDANEPRDGD
jgi:antitoxin component YwqK of YwqJK toxin-antitoxin module